MVDQRMKGRSKTGSVVGKALEVIVALVILYFLATWILNSLAVTNIAGSTILTITNQSTLFQLEGSEYSASFVYTSGNVSQIQLTHLPTFLNPTIYVVLQMNNATKVNGFGKYANMEIKLISSTPSSTQVSITPISVNLTLLPDYSRISSAQATLSPFGSQGGTQPIITTTTTVPTSTTTSSSTSSSTTTTTTASGYSKAVTLLQKDIYYGLLLNYSSMYSNTTGCTSSLYSSTYTSKYGSGPSGLDSYANVSTLVPYALTLNITQNATNSNYYVATYSTQSHQQSLTGGPALIINMNTTGGYIKSSQPTGIWGGLNYTRISCGYNKAKAIGNACGIYVTSSSFHPSTC